jgi:hypothetical protein
MEGGNAKMKRQVEIDDDLDERVGYVKDELLDNFIDFLEENKDIQEFDTYYQKSGADAMHEVSDSNTPIYYSGIDGLYYLYSSEFEDAYKNEGIGNGGEENHKQVAIYCYLSEKAGDYIRELEEKFDEWKSSDPEIPIEEFIKQLKEVKENDNEN